MPYGISNKQSDCNGWAMVKQNADGTFETMACYTNKQEAIDYMIASSLGEDVEPIGEIRAEAVNLSPPAYMREAAKLGLKYHADGLSGDGIVAQTIEDARKMASGIVTEEKWRKIAPWIARHMSDLDAIQGDEITAGFVAHLLWGSDGTKEGAKQTMNYAEKVVSQLDAQENQTREMPIEDIVIEDNAVEGDACPIATQDVAINLTNRGKAIRVAAYGPLNPAEPNDSFWQDKADRWKVTIDDARTALCGNCAAFDTSESMKACIEGGLSGESDDWNAVDAGDLGFCEVFDFKCASSRTCDAWIARKADAVVPDEEPIDTEDVPMKMDSADTQRTNHWVVAERENRSIAFSNLELRASSDGKTLVGYAAVFDSPSEPLPWTEFVRRGAFAKTIKDGADVRLLIDHEGVPLARSKSGTLTMQEDDYGLRIEAMLDENNPDAAKVMSALRRGDLSQMSFAFQTVKDSWSTDKRTRELKEVRLYDVSVVTYPAYEETVAELRNKNNTQSATVSPVAPLALRKRQIQLRQLQAEQ